MNQSKAFLTSLIFAAAAMMLVYFYISEKEGEIKSEFGAEVTVVVAARDIREFVQLEPGMLSTRSIPSKFAQPGWVSSKEEILKNGAVAAAPFKQGEQIPLTKIIFQGAETGLASQVAISYRALSIPVSNVTGVTKLLKPGDRVDIVSNISYQGTGGQESEVKTVLQNVNILAVGESIMSNIPTVETKDPLTGEVQIKRLRGDRNYETVTVEVMPVEAQSLIYIVQSGTELVLTLRNPVDRVIASIPTTSVDEVLGPTSKKVTRNRPPPPPAYVPKVVSRLPASVAPNPWTQGGGPLVK